MAIIYSYPKIDEVQGSDLILVADASKRNQTKSASVDQLLQGQATIIQVDDRVVTGASFNTNDGVLTLTRNGGDIPSVTTDLDGRYALTSSLATVATTGAYDDLTGQPTIPTNNNELTNGAGYTTNLGVVQSLETEGTSGAATLVNGVLNVPQYSGSGSSIIQQFSRTFAASELISTFNGIDTSKIQLLEAPGTNKFYLVQDFTAYIYGNSAPNQRFNADDDLYVIQDSDFIPSASYSVYGNIINNGFINTNAVRVSFKSATGFVNEANTETVFNKAMVLRARPGFGVSITEGDGTIEINFSYRIIDFS